MYSSLLNNDSFHKLLKLKQYCVNTSETFLVSGGEDSLVKVWDKDNQLLHTLSGHIGIVRAIYLDDWKIVSAGDRRKIIVWDLKHGKQFTQIHRQPNLIQHLAVTTSSLACASDADGTMSIVSFNRTGVPNYSLS